MEDGLLASGWTWWNNAESREVRRPLGASVSRMRAMEMKRTRARRKNLNGRVTASLYDGLYDHVMKAAIMIRFVQA